MSLVADPDDELLQRFAEGDPEAFVSFYRRHVHAMLSFFVRRTSDPELAADLTAEVFAAALGAAGRFRPGERPAIAWLYGIAAHKLADSRRRGRVEASARKRLSLEPLVLEDEDIARIEQLAGGDDNEARLQAAVEALPSRQRDAVLARIVDERPYAEIASAMSCSELVVRKQVSRGLRNLRSTIEEPR
jgi:RNA polymerase sigma-70 factor (ECF subfamily)